MVAQYYFSGAGIPLSIKNTTFQSYSETNSCLIFFFDGGGGGHKGTETKTQVTGPLEIKWTRWKKTSLKYIHYWKRKLYIEIFPKATGECTVSLRDVQAGNSY